VRILGTDHPDTLASRNNLATAYQDAGRIDEAITLHENNPVMRHLILASGHAEPLSRDDIPTVTSVGVNGISQFRLIHERTRADGNRTIRAGHPDFLGYLNNLATAYLEAGRLSKADEYLGHAHSEKVRILGPEHPSTLVSQNNQAISYLEAGRHRQALTLLDQARADSLRILGANHRITRTIHQNFTAARATKATASRLLRTRT
jgi:tetratricopeptide (TPR) repeat protein